MLKKIFSILICFSVMLTVSAVSVNQNAEAAKVYDTPYYYEQLTQNAQKTYTVLKKAVINCERSVKIKYDINENDFEQIAELLIFHDPMTFNLKNIEAEQASRNTIIFKLSYRYDKDTFDDMAKAYRKEAKKILNKLTDDMSRYKKIRTIHDSIINSAVYDINSETSDNIYGTLVENKGKCDGYAKSFSYICGQAGIRTVTVIGDDKSYSNDTMHMWNKVYYNKNWYNVDVTWDDPVSNIKDNLKYDFFMVSDDAIKNTHSEDNFSFVVPAAEDDSKDYFKVNKKYAESFDEGKTILKNGIISAVKKNKYSVSFECADKKIFDKMKSYILDIEKITDVLKSVRKKTGGNIITDIYSYKFNENQYIICVYFFYNDTDLDDYFTSTEELNAESLDALAEYGID